jgi:uncharacterized protein YukE
MGTNDFYNKLNSADNKTEITHSSVKDSVSTIEKSSKNMGQYFQEFRNTMGEVYKEDNFSGEASDSLQTKFNEFQKKFDSYTDAVERFAKAVEGARASTEATEQSIKQDIENLPQ